MGFRTRPDICWAVTRVSRAAMTGESEHEMEEKARIQIKHILQYFARPWSWCLTIRPHEHTHVNSPSCQTLQLLQGEEGVMKEL
eukprot:12644823-Prorocentrum_lima.AAC.1